MPSFEATCASLSISYPAAGQNSTASIAARRQGMTQPGLSPQVLQLRALRTAYKQDIAMLRARRLELGNRLQARAWR